MIGRIWGRQTAASPWLLIHTRNNPSKRPLPTPLLQRKSKFSNPWTAYRNGHSVFDEKLRFRNFVYRLNPEEQHELLLELQRAEANRLVGSSKHSHRKVQLPSFRQLRYVALFSGIPFIGFGILDNTIMLTAGEYIDLKFGAFLGISTLAAAGLGNMLSDIVGIGTAGAVEQAATRMGMRPPALSPQQTELARTRRAANLGRAIGVTVGCIIGMWPLLLLRDSPTNEDTPEENS